VRIVKMKYGHDSVQFGLRESNILGEIALVSQKDNRTEEKIILAALKQPIGTRRLTEIVQPGKRVCVIVSDVSRLYQKPYLFLPYIVRELNSAGIPDQNIFFLCANGGHRLQSEQERGQILGEQLAGRFRVIDHDCRDDGQMVYTGTTSYGTQVFLNKLALDCDYVVLTGGITTHDMVVWGGGRKAIFPGIASFDAIMKNHALYFERDSVAYGQRKYDGNLQHLDMLEAAAMVKPCFLFNVIMGEDGDIADAVAGDYQLAHTEGCRIAASRLAVPISQLADVAIVSCGGYPKDADLYLASKCFENPTFLVKKGGYIIFLAECPEGIGFDEVAEVMQNFSTNDEREKYVRENFTMGKLTGYWIPKMFEDYKPIFVTKLEQSVFRNTNVIAVDSIEQALKMVEKDYGHDYKAYIVPDAINILPMVQQQQ
jgi:lactate racemase